MDVYSQENQRTIRQVIFQQATPNEYPRRPWFMTPRADPMSFQELWRRTKPPQLGHRYRKFTRNSGLKNHGFPVPDTSGHIPSKIPEPYDLYPDRQIRISPKFHKVHLKFTAMVFRCCSFLSFCFFWGNQKVSKLGMHCTAGKILCGSCDDLFGESHGRNWRVCGGKHDTAHWYIDNHTMIILWSLYSYVQQE